SAQTPNPGLSRGAPARVRFLAIFAETYPDAGSRPRGVPGGAQMRPRDFTASRSEASSATVASIFSRENSLISTPSMISQAPLSERTGNEVIRPSGTPYEPSDTTAADVQDGPFTQSATWSMAAWGAGAAEG